MSDSEMTTHEKKRMVVDEIKGVPLRPPSQEIIDSLDDGMRPYMISHSGSPGGSFVRSRKSRLLKSSSFSDSPQKLSEFQSQNSASQMTSSSENVAPNSIKSSGERSSTAARNVSRSSSTKSLTTPFTQNTTNQQVKNKITVLKSNSFKDDRAQTASTETNVQIKNIQSQSSLLVPNRNSKGRMLSGSSSEAIDYYNKTLADYSSPGTSTSEDLYGITLQKNVTNSSAEHVFNDSRRSSIISEGPRAEHSGSDSDSELSSQEEYSYDVTVSRRGSRDSIRGPDAMNLTVMSDSRTRSKRRKKGNRSTKVTKYKEDAKTVRRHIKPGTVEGLTNMFDKSKDQETNVVLLETNWPGPEQIQGKEETYFERIKTSSLADKDYQSNASQFDYLSASKAIMEQAKLNRGNNNMSTSSVSYANEANERKGDSNHMQGFNIERNSSTSLRDSMLSVRDKNDGVYPSHNKATIFTSGEAENVDNLRYSQITSIDTKRKKNRVASSDTDINDIVNLGRVEKNDSSQKIVSYEGASVSDSIVDKHKQFAAGLEEGEVRTNNLSGNYDSRFDSAINNEDIMPGTRGYINSTTVVRTSEMKNVNKDNEKKDLSEENTTSKTFTRNFHSSFTNGHSSHIDSNNDKMDGKETFWRADGELKVNNETKKLSEAERADFIIAHLSSDLLTPTTENNQFAFPASPVAERDKKSMNYLATNEEEREDKNDDRDEQSHLGQFSTSSTFTQVGLNERHSDYVSYYPSSAGPGVLNSDDFNALLSGIDLNAKPSELSPSENSHNEYHVAQKEDLYENNLLHSDSMKIKKNKEQTSFAGESVSSASKVSIKTESGEQSARHIKIASDSETELGAADRSHGSIDDEIRELHLQLSPSNSNKVVEETTYKLEQNVSSDAGSGSLSSHSSNIKDRPGVRETAFNYEFFYGNKTSEEKNGLISSVDQNYKSASLSHSDVSEAREGGRLDGSKTHQEVAKLPSSVFDTSNLTSTRQSSSFLQSDLPVDKNERDLRVSSRESFRSTTVLGDISQKTKEGRESDSNSHSRKLSAEHDVIDTSIQNGSAGKDIVFNRQDHVSSVYNNNEEVIISEGQFVNTRIESSNEKQHRQEETEKEKDDMAAIVGEVSSFNVHRKVTSFEESTTLPSNRSSTSRMQTVPLDGSDRNDIYLIQDKGGDMYALQEIGTTNDTNTESVTTIRTVNTGNGNDSTTSFQPGAFSGNNNYTDNQSNTTDIYVDSASVDDDKARELIDAYLSSGSKTVTNQSSESNMIRESSNYSHSQSIINADHSRGFDVSGGNTSGLLNNTVPSKTASSSHSVVVHQGVNGYDFPNNSNITVNEEISAKGDTSQTWDIPGYEPYTTGSGGEHSYNRSLIVTNVNTPQQQSQITYSNQPGVDSQRFNSVVNTPNSTSVLQPLTVNINQAQGVTPFPTRPITIQTTTNAVVGEKVDMTIDFPPQNTTYPPYKITATADLGTSSSDDENKHFYVIRSSTPPLKSALRRGSAYSSENKSLDSNSDIVYNKKETTTGEIILGGQKSGSTVFDSNKETKHMATHSESLSTSSDNSPKYSVRQNQDHGRESYRRNQKISIKHHSPERVFKNSKLSLRKSDYDTNSYSSDEETRQYTRVTKVKIDRNSVDKSRSPSSSPTNRYRVSSQNSFNGGQYRDGKSYQIVAKGKGDESDSYSDNDSETEMSQQQHRYKVVSKSDSFIDKREIKANSPASAVNSKSIDEAVIHRMKTVQPSKLQINPSSSKSHQTVIQLEAGDENNFREKNRTVNTGSSYTESNTARAKSIDSIDGRNIRVISNGFNSNIKTPQKWRESRTGSAISVSEDSSSSEFEGSGAYKLSSPKVVKTSKQKKGNKTYVVNSTLNDQHQHPSGYYKSTIDINENHPDNGGRSLNAPLTNLGSFRDQESFSQSERKTEEHRNSYKTEEKSMYFIRQKSQPTSTKVRFQTSPDSGQGTEVASSEGENEVRKEKFERVERIYEVKTDPVIPEQFQDKEDLSKDMRVLRGKIIITNRLDSEHSEEDFDQNVNVFDTSFHMDKDNPLYSSDTDLQASLQKEEEEELLRQIKEDMTFEQINKLAQHQKTKPLGVDLNPKPKKKQNLSTLLLAKLANVDSRDIRQTIDVRHHNEDIFGNIDFIHADGEHKTSSNTSNFDSVSEKVELTLQQGRAFVIIKVIAERIVPTDYEFNVWRKSQAIVTRQIEVDLLANDQRRRFYNLVMDTRGTPAVVDFVDGKISTNDKMTANEKQLSSLETIKLFSQILDVADDGQGDQDHTSMRTKQAMGQLGADLLY